MHSAKAILRVGRVLSVFLLLFLNFLHLLLLLFTFRDRSSSFSVSSFFTQPLSLLRYLLHYLPSFSPFYVHSFNHLLHSQTLFNSDAASFSIPFVVLDLIPHSPLGSCHFLCLNKMETFGTCPQLTSASALRLFAFCFLVCILFANFFFLFIIFSTLVFRYASVGLFRAANVFILKLSSPHYGSGNSRFLHHDDLFVCSATLVGLWRVCMFVLVGIHLHQRRRMETSAHLPNVCCQMRPCRFFPI